MGERTNAVRGDQRRNGRRGTTMDVPGRSNPIDRVAVRDRFTARARRRSLLLGVISRPPATIGKGATSDRHDITDCSQNGLPIHASHHRRHRTEACGEANDEERDKGRRRAEQRNDGGRAAWRGNRCLVHDDLLNF
jgi:hypothetical protein